VRRSLTWLVFALPLACSSSERPAGADSSQPVESKQDAAAGAPQGLEWASTGAFQRVYDSTPRYINDHTFIHAKDGTWHLFGITGAIAPLGEGPDAAKEISFAHATATRLEGPWTSQPDVLPLDKSYFGEVHVWAPHVVESDGTYYMFYAGGAGGDAAISVATSSDLYQWKRRTEGPLFRDGLEARDPFVTRVGDKWVMYYCATTEPGGGPHAVAYRQSDDLVHWGARGIAYVDGSTSGNSISNTESPAVLQKDGKFYLFVGPRGGYVGTDVFQSTDPFHFELDGYRGHIAAHAPEIIEDGGRQWISASGWFQSGVWLAPIEWRSFPGLWPSASPAAAVGVDKQLVVAKVDEATSMGKNADGRLEAFLVQPETGNVMRRTQGPNGTFGPWQDFDTEQGAGAAPALAQAPDGRLEAFFLGRGGRSILHRTQDTANGTWNSVDDFGGPAGAPPTVGVNADGRLEVFALAPGGATIQHRFQLEPNGRWGDWSTFSGPSATAPTVGRNVDGRLEVFTVIPYGLGIAHRYQLRPSGEWSAWENFSSWVESTPVVASNADGRLEVFVVGPGGSFVMHRFQTAPNGAFGAWERFGDAASRPPSVVMGDDGRLTVFLVRPDGSIVRRVQNAPSGTWGDWTASP
jgi:hypothetical protein